MPNLRLRRLLPHRIKQQQHPLLLTLLPCSSLQLQLVFLQYPSLPSMGKLRDWWPSEDSLERRKLTSHDSANSPAQNGFGSAALRLSEVAAALNSMPTQAVATSSEAAPPAPMQSFSRPVVKLTNSQDHKDELLRKLLNRSASSTDLQIKPPPCPRSPSSSRSSKSASVESDQHRNCKRSSNLHELQDKPIQKDSLTRREIHIFSERQRRKGMTHLYSTLHSLLPEAKPKTDRCTVLTEAMDYIHVLRKKVEDLGRQRAEILGSTGDHLDLDLGVSIGGESSSTSRRMPIDLSDEMKEEFLSAADVAVRFCGKDAFIMLNTPKKTGVWSGILQIMQEQDMELLNVTLSTSNDMNYHCIHAKIPTASELRSQDLQKMLQDLVLSHAVFDGIS